MVGHIEVTRVLWGAYPFPLQQKLCSVRAIHELNKFVQQYSNHPEMPACRWPDDMKKSMDFLVDALSLVVAEDNKLVNELRTFDGESLLFGNTLSLMLDIIDGKPGQASSTTTTRGGSEGEFCLDICEVISKEEKSSELNTQQVQFKHDMEDSGCPMKLGKTDAEFTFIII